MSLKTELKKLISWDGYLKGEDEQYEQNYF